MPRRVKVQQLPNDQFVVTIPKALAEAMGIRKGDRPVVLRQGRSGAEEDPVARNATRHDITRSDRLL